MPLPATRYATTTPINPTATVAGVRYRLELTDIPALAGFWADAENVNKRQGRAYDDATEAELATYWHSYDHASKTAVVFVYVPSVLASGAPKLRVYPPVAANSEYTDIDTYGRNAVWPGVIAAPLDGLTDVTGNNRTFVAETGQGITTAAGKVGTAVKFPSTGGYAAYDAGAGGISGFPLTIMGWAKADDWTAPNQQALFSISNAVDAATAERFWIRSWFGSSLRLEYKDSGGGSVRINVTPLSTGWHHYGIVLTASQMIAYIDGVSVGSDSHTLLTPDLRYLMLGSDFLGMAGLIDEAHFIAADPTPAWIAYYYAMTNDPASFYSAWATEGAPAVGGNRSRDRSRER